MEPILGFRVWMVADVKPLTAFPAPDPLKAAAGHHVVNPDVDAWLSKRLYGEPAKKDPKPKRRAEPGTLRAVGYLKGSSVWRDPAPTYRFQCWVGHEHPDFNCSCGLYACFTVAEAERRGGDVIGAVIAWGRVVLHGIQGFRAEHMRIVALASRDPRRTKRARLAAERYGVHMVDRDQLEIVGREFGRPITWSYDL